MHPVSAPAAVRYRIRPARPADHVFEVELLIADPDPAGQRLSLPAWIPGSYMIRDFARHVMAVEARSADGPVVVEKLDKQTWRCAPAPAPLFLRYEVYARDLSVRGAHLDTRHGYFNGTSVFLQVAGAADQPCEVDILPPPPSTGARWRVATTLPPAGAPAWGFGRYRAADYEELVDHPVEMGTFDLVGFEVAGVPHHIAVTGRHDADLERISRDLARICETHLELFGRPFPAPRYLFLLTVTGEGYGGLEHRASTSLICSRQDLPPVAGGDQPPVDEGYRRFLGLCSHEYFHTWNVKRIRPAAFTGCSLEREAYTRDLWVFEGITSYYDDLGLLRAGLVSAADYLDLLARTATRVQRGRGRLRQSLAESSFDAWTRFYLQGPEAPDTIVSYYAKGALVALGLDLLLRQDGKGRSLDGLMRLLWERHGRTGAALPEGGFEALAAEYAGRSLAAYFDRAVRGTGDLPLADWLRPFGVEAVLRCPVSISDEGGRAPAGESLEVDPGVSAAADPLGVRLRQVYEGGAARLAGLAPGDVIVALDGIRTDMDRFPRQLRRLRPGQRVQVHAFRGDELLQHELRLRSAPRDRWEFKLAAGPDSEAAARRSAWLGGRA